MYVYPIEGSVNGKNSRINVASGGTVSASGKIGFGIKTYDKHNGATNNNGTFKIDIFVDDEQIYGFTANRLAFYETRAINSVCDFEDIQKNNSWVYQSQIQEGNPLRLFSNVKDYGTLNLDDKTYKIKMVVSDYAGNSTSTTFNLKGSKSENNSAKEPQNWMKWNEKNEFKTNDLELYFPKGVFYHNFDFKYNLNREKHQIGDYYMPLHSYYTMIMTPPTSIPTAQLDKAVIVRQYMRRGTWRKDYINPELKNGKLVAQARDFGIFSVELDTTKPTITAVNVKDGSIFSSQNGIVRLKISDKQSGIKEYKAYINGKWILAEYDKKVDLLTIDLNKEGIDAGSYLLELTVKDEKNNIATYTANITKNA